jgi:hypothetical protein
LFPLFAIGVINTGGKFATSIKNTSKTGGKIFASVVDTGGKFATGVVDTGGAPWLANISANFLKQFETVLMGYSGAGGNLIREKNQKQTFRDTVQQKRAGVTQNRPISSENKEVGFSLFFLIYDFNFLAGSSVILLDLFWWVWSLSWMKEVRDNTSRKGGQPTLPSLYMSTFQPSQRGFFRVHVCKGGRVGENIYRVPKCLSSRVQQFWVLKRK